ncbi:MAG: fasciclin domain-containing protein [Candidatus Buchananbacteria bacterium]
MRAMILILGIIIVVVVVSLGIFYPNGQKENNFKQLSQTTNNNLQIDATSSTSQNNNIELMDIVSLARATGNFNTFFVAMLQSGLDGSFNVGGPYTIFMPTDKAFGKIDQKTAQRLVNDRQFLVKVLQNHIVSGARLKDSLRAGDSFESINNTTVSIGGTDNVITINGAKIIAPDLIASNGVIQGIDAVLIGK